MKPFRQFLMNRARTLSGTFFHPWALGSQLIHGTGNYIGTVGGHGLKVVGSIAATAIVGSTTPIQRTFTVEATDEDGNQLPWIIAESTAWLSVTPASGTGPTTITATIDPTGVAAGAYTGDVAITAAGAQGSPKTLTARLTVYSVPVIDVSVASLEFSSLSGSSPANQTVLVTDGSAFPGAPFTFTVSDDAAWLTTSKQNSLVTVSADAGVLSDGIYTGTITIISPESSNSPQTVSVSLAVASNAIVAENFRAADTFYPLSDLGDVSNQGFATAFSVDAGETASFKVDGDSQQIEIFRLGHYSNGLYRKVATISNTPTAQPAAATIPDTYGATSCAAWSVTASWPVPATAVSGLYVAVVRNAALTAHSHVFFIVRNDSRAADIVVKLSDSTWGAAYNTFGAMGSSVTILGGKSLYGTGPGVSDGGGIGTRAVQVSMDRPIITLGQIVNHPYNYELALISYLEEQGYNVKYIGCYDLDVGTARVGSAKVLICAGHDEYWSENMLNNAKALQNTGKHLVFMSANDVFWKIRYKNAGRVVECYKDTMDGPDGSGHVGGVEFDPLGWTGTWRDTRWEGRQPENLLFGTTFRMNGIFNLQAVITADPYGKHPLWRNTTVESGDLAIPGIIGFEANTVDAPSKAMSGRGAATLLNIDGSYADDNGQTYNNNGDLDWGIVAMRYNTNQGMSISFASMNWIWGLSDNHLGAVKTVNAAVRQSAVNMLADMGVAAATLSPSLVQPTPLPENYYGVGHKTLPTVQALYPAFEYDTDFLGIWAQSTVYAIGQVVKNPWRNFVCTVGHTASLDNEPGVGPTWEGSWREINPALPSAKIVVNAAALEFTASIDQTPASQQIQVTNPGVPSLNFIISATVPWITVTPTSGVDEVLVTVSCTAQSVEDTYVGAITITAAGANNSPQTIPVTYTVSSAALEETLYDTNPVPANVESGAGDPSSYSFGCTFKTIKTVEILGVKFWRPNTDTIPCTVGIYSATAGGAAAPILASQANIDTSAGGWVSAYFDSPIVGTQDSLYCAAYCMNGNAGYPYEPNVFNSDVIVGNINAPGASSGVNNNLLVAGTSLAPPTGVFNASRYYVSPIVKERIIVGDQSFFPLNPIPALTSDELDTYTLGMDFYSFYAPGIVKGIRMWRPAGADTGKTLTAKLWDRSTGTELGSVAFPSNPAGGWVSASFATPISIAAGQVVVAGVHPISHYGYLAEFFQDPYTTNGGDLFAGRQNGCFLVSGVMAMPTQYSNTGTTYYVDVLFEATPT